MYPVTDAITDTSMLAAQIENLRFKQKACSSGKRVDNRADSRQDSQVCPATKIVILELLYFTFSLQVSSLKPHSARIFFIGKQNSTKCCPSQQISSTMLTPPGHIHGLLGHYMYHNEPYKVRSTEKIVVITADFIAMYTPGFSDMIRRS